MHGENSGRKGHVVGVEGSGFSRSLHASGGLWKPPLNIYVLCYYPRSSKRLLAFVSCCWCITCCIVKRGHPLLKKKLFAENKNEAPVERLAFIVPCVVFYFTLSFFLLFCLLLLLLLLLLVVVSQGVHRAPRSLRRANRWKASGCARAFEHRGHTGVDAAHASGRDRGHGPLQDRRYRLGGERLYVLVHLLCAFRVNTVGVTSINSR